MRFFKAFGPLLAVAMGASAWGQSPTPPAPAAGNPAVRSGDVSAEQQQKALQAMRKAAQKAQSGQKPAQQTRATYGDIVGSGKSALAQVHATPLPPPAPPRPEQLPARPPQVAYREGLLTIVADNSTLGDILNAIRKQTGAAVDVTGGGASERVVMHAGPAPAQEVLAQLFNGSKFNYVLMGSPSDPGGIGRIVLREKPSPSVSAGGNPITNTYTPNPYNQPSPENTTMPAQQDSFTQPEEQQPEGANPPPSENPPANPPQPVQQPQPQSPNPQG